MSYDVRYRMNNSKKDDTRQEKTKSPSFQFYAAEYLSDEGRLSLSLEEEGAYITALAICWREGSIPADPKLLAKIIGKGCTEDIARVVQPLFKGGSTDPVRLRHKRLDEERTKQALWREKSKEGGRASARKRQQYAKESITSELKGGSTGPVQPNVNSSSSSSSSSSLSLYLDLKDKDPEKILNVDIPKGDKTPLSKALDMWAAHLLKKYNKVFDEIARDALMMTRGSNPLELAEDILYSIANGWKTINRKPMSEKARIETQVAAKVAATKEPLRPAPKVYVPPAEEKVNPEAVAKFKESLKNIGNLPRPKDQKEGH